jgi:hypothetical protein
MLLQELNKDMVYGSSKDGKNNMRATDQYRCDAAEGFNGAMRRGWRWRVK